MEKFSNPHESRRLRPTVLAYRHEIADHFPDREAFEETAVNVAFAGPLNADDHDPDAVWGFTPEKIKMYMEKGSAAVVVSQVSPRNKFSRGYNACTGIAGVGIELETGIPLSFLSHSDPTCLLGLEGVTPEERDTIANKLRERVSEMVRRCDPEKLNFEIVGGGYYNLNKLVSYYMQSVRYLGDLIEAETGRRPYVSFGPNTELGRNDEDTHKEDRPLHPGSQTTDVYIDTEHLGITIVRPEQHNARWNNPFVAPRNYEEWKALSDSSIGANDGILPLGTNTTESLELWESNPEKWREIYGGK